MFFFIAGTVKVKSSNIQVGDLIIVEKVCHKSFHPHLYIVWLLWTYQDTINVMVNNEQVVQSAPTRVGGERS